MFGEEISAKIPPKRRPAYKKGQKKNRNYRRLFFKILHPTLGFQGGIEKLPLSKFHRRKEWKKKSPY